MLHLGGFIVASRRATAFSAAIKELRQSAKLTKAEAIGYISVSSQYSGWMASKCRRIILRQEKKAAQEAGF